MQCIPLPPPWNPCHAGTTTPREIPLDPSGWRNVSMRSRVRENDDTRRGSNPVTTRRPLGQAQTGGDYSWISMAIWIIYWTVSLDTTGQSHVIYWHPLLPPVSLLVLPSFIGSTHSPSSLFALLVPSPWRPVYPLSPLIRIGASVEMVKNVFPPRLPLLSHSLSTPSHFSFLPVLIQHNPRIAVDLLLFHGRILINFTCASIFLDPEKYF